MRGRAGVLLLAALVGCSSQPPGPLLPEAPPSVALETPGPPPPARVDSPLCTDLRELVRLRGQHRRLGGAVRRDANDEQVAALATRTLAAVEGGSDGVLPAELAQALRDYAARAPEDQARDGVLATQTGRLCPG